MTNREELESAIRTAPNAAPGYLVYADWLQANGDPRGELITVQHRKSEATGTELHELSAREAEILGANEGFLPGVSNEHATAQWRWGFFDSVWFNNIDDWMDNKFEIVPIVTKVLNLPSAACLRELQLGILRWDYQHEDVPAVLNEVARLGKSAQLRTLRLGHIGDDDVDLAHHTLGVLSMLSESYRGLEELTLYGSDFEFDALDLPNLRRLKIETCGLAAQSIAAICELKRPSLQDLELWFGSNDYGGEGDIDSVAALLDGSIIPNVTRLALMNAEFTNDLCDALSTAAVVAQLDVLDLSLGTMSDEGAQLLIDHRDAFKHLRELDVDDNFLSDGRVQELRDVFGDALFSEQQRETDAEEPDWRYVAAGE